MTESQSPPRDTLLRNIFTTAVIALGLLAPFLLFAGLVSRGCQGPDTGNAAGAIVVGPAALVPTPTATVPREVPTDTPLPDGASAVATDTPTPEPDVQPTEVPPTATMSAATPGGATSASETPTPAPTPTPPPLILSGDDGIDPQAVCQDLRNPAWWATVALLLGFGAIGGLIFELLGVLGSVEWPHKPTSAELRGRPTYASPSHVYDLGVVARLLIGATAAVIATPIVAPGTTLGLITLALIAGSIGSAVYETLQTRLKASLAIFAHGAAIEDAKIGAASAEAAVESLKGLNATALRAAPEEAARAARDISVNDQAIDASAKVGEALGVLKTIARRDLDIT